jgi:hypothetical protein
MSFGEFVSFVGFIQKTINVDLDVRINRTYLLRNKYQKVPEDSKGLHKKERDETPLGGLTGPT